MGASGGTTVTAAHYEERSPSIVLRLPNIFSEEVEGVEDFVYFVELTRPCSPVIIGKMNPADEALHRLQSIPGLAVRLGAPLKDFTRFALGGPCLALASTREQDAFTSALAVLTGSGAAWTTLGGGTNLIVRDEGYEGIVLKYDAARISLESETTIRVEAGAELNALVDFANANSLAGLEAMAGIPGWSGAAIYGNAGAYGQSISERVAWVCFADGDTVRRFDNAECDFRYRESIFKRNKSWQILSAGLEMKRGNRTALEAASAAIRAQRDAKFPPSMRCAGSIFKNLLLRELPPEIAAEVPGNVVREGKIPAGWFLEQVGAKGLHRNGIRVADYHANLVYNAGGGTAADLVSLLVELKQRVAQRFGLLIEEEVQFLGFGGSGRPTDLPLLTVK